MDVKARMYEIYATDNPPHSDPKQKIWLDQTHASLLATSYFLLPTSYFLLPTYDLRLFFKSVDWTYI